MMTCNTYDTIIEFFNKNPDDGHVMINLPLAHYTSFKLGGTVDLFCDVYSYEGLSKIVNICSEKKFDLKILGFGTNILVQDNNIQSVVIRLNGDMFDSIEKLDNDRLKIGSRASLKKLIILSHRWSLSGIEWLTGIPASFGGAIVSNVGAFGHCMGDIIENITVMDPDGTLKTHKKSDLNFQYRTNPFTNGEIIIEATIQLKTADKISIYDNIKNIKRQRKNRFPKGKNAGCVFKNPDNVSAGELIDKAGFKGKRINGAVVSKKHANFIVNESDATANDVLELIRSIQDEVKQKTGVQLELEIKIWS